MEGSMEGENTSPGPINKNCLNCGTELTDKFCPHCGQKDLPKRQSMGELIENFIGSFYSFESKFFKTVKYLLFKPGFLPLEYTAGRRESYYHPARAYVFISFVFFLLFFSLPDSDTKNDSDAPDKDELNEIGRDTLTQDTATNNIIASQVDTKDKKVGYTIQGEYVTIAQYDSAQNALPEAKRDGWFGRKLNIRIIELKERYKDKGGDKSFEKDFVQTFTDNFSKVLFYNLPIFALLLKLLYVRRDFYYSEHLVFSIYYYNFFYLAGSFSLVANLIPGLSWLSIVIGFWIMAYLLLAMKRMYQQSWRKTLLKYGLFSIVFFVCLGIGLTINALLTLMWL